MNYWLYIIELLTSIAIFVLGMNFIEESLHSVAGRRFKLFLKQQTSSNLKAITGGTLVTGILQSSSIVNMMILAFVGAGVLTLERALAVILGDNLGTTVDSWFFATAGFSFNIEYIAYAFTGIAGIVILFFPKNSRAFYWCKFFLGIGFLFLGLNMMKVGMMDLVTRIDLASLERHNALFFLCMGLVITTLIQSSSATIAILLSALYAHAISLFDATAIVLGSEIGTTLKFLVAAMNGTANKKRVALGNFLFNVITSFIVLIFLQPVNNFIVVIIGIRNPLVALVFFQSFLNLAGILLFFPFLGRFAQLLETLFTKRQEPTSFIHLVSPGNTELAIDAFEKETRTFLCYVTDYNLAVFKSGEETTLPVPLSERYLSSSLTGKYDFIRELHGTLHGYYVEMQSSCSDRDDIIRLENLVSAIRNSIYAAKSMKDGLPDADMLRNSSNDLKYSFYVETTGKARQFYGHITHILERNDTSGYFNELVSLFKDVQHGYTQTVKGLYKQPVMKQLNEVEISCIINFNRQVYTSFKSMLLAVKDYVLDEKEAEYFDGLPGFIH